MTRPDLRTDSVSPPPGTKARGTSFSVTDTVRNIGAVSSAASTTRYYLSTDVAKNTGDTLLIGYRAVGTLARNATSSAPATVTIPSTAPLATYHLLACADDTSVVAETDETNNCTASVSTVTITP